MFLAQIDAHNVDDLIGQIRSDLLLRAPQNKGRNIGRQTPEHRRVRAIFDGPAHLLLECLPRGQEAGARQGKQRPQVSQRVFDGGTRHRQLPGRLKIAKRSVGCGARVFHRLRFIDDNSAEAHLVPLLRLQAGERVGGDDDIHIGNLLLDRRPTARGRFRHRAHTQVRCEGARLVYPHANDGGRRHDENGRGIAGGCMRSQRCHSRQDLNGFTQAHVICQNSTDSTGQASR